MCYWDAARRHVSTLRSSRYFSRYSAVTWYHYFGRILPGCRMLVRRYQNASVVDISNIRRLWWAIAYRTTHRAARAAPSHRRAVLCFQKRLITWPSRAKSTFTFPKLGTYRHSYHRCLSPHFGWKLCWDLRASTDIHHFTTVLPMAMSLLWWERRFMVDATLMIFSLVNFSFSRWGHRSHFPFKYNADISQPPAHFIYVKPIIEDVDV